MYRLMLATLMVGLLGCGSGEESQPQASTDKGNSATSSVQVDASKVDKLIADGKRLFDTKKYAAAIEVFSKAIQLDDRSAIAYRERARASMFAGGHNDIVGWTSNVAMTHVRLVTDHSTRPNFQKALADLQVAIRLDASDVEAYKLQGRCLMELGDGDRGIAAFSEAIRLDPQDADAYHKRGAGYFHLSDWTKAAADFTRAIELDPKMVKSLSARALTKMFVGDSAGALVDFDDIIRHDDTNALAYINRSQVYFQMGEFEKTAADCTRAIELEPHKSIAYTYRGGAYVKLGETSKAMADFSKAIALDSRDHRPHANRAVAYMKTGLFSKALADVDAAIELMPDSAHFLRFRAQILAKMDRPNEARASQRKAEWVEQSAPLNRAVINRPEDPQNYQRRAVHYADDEQWENAISDFNKVLQLDPKSADALVGRAKAWLAMGEFQKAIDDCDRAAKHSSQREIYSVRGDAYLELGDYDRAISDYERSRRFDTQVAEAYLLRSKERKAAGDAAAADKDWRHAIAIDPSLSGLR